MKLYWKQNEVSPTSKHWLEPGALEQPSQSGPRGPASETNDAMASTGPV